MDSRDAIVMANARRLIKAKKITSNGRLYMELFGTGLSTARSRCLNDLGLDPDSNKTSYTEMMAYLLRQPTIEG
jgi:hypothetical protein